MKSMSSKALEQLLDSDDELPTFYNETPDIPAYQNDYRFVSSSSDLANNIQPEKPSTASTLNSILNIETVQAKTQRLKKDEKALIMTGFLKQQDLYCLNCIEKVCSDKTILWFVNYLIYKDLLGRHKLTTSCLVGDVYADYSNDIPLSFFNEQERKYKFEISVKNH